MGRSLTEVHENNGIATLVLDDPSKRNALSRTMVSELNDALDRIEERDLRCLELRGANGTFCAGGDIDKMVERFESDLDIEREIRELSRTTGRLVTRIAKFPLPTVARIAGPAFGAGATLAIACDLQVAHEEATIAFGFRRVGLAIDSGTSYLLPRVVGENVAKELVFTGRPIDAAEAEELGLLNGVYGDDFEERADELVTRIAEGPTVALRQDKRLLDEGFEKSIERAAADEAIAQGIAFQTADHTEGVEAFLEDREPSFTGE